VTYEIVDSGNFQKLERFGDQLLLRPCGQAVWKPQRDESVWQKATGVFTREGRWRFSEPVTSWDVEVDGIHFTLQPTEFGHLGIFPEQRPLWGAIRKLVQGPIRVLNLFAYSGGSTIAAAKAGASVCHLDASKGMVQWARQNANINGCEHAPIRWIVEDVIKFLQREVRRNSLYDAIILDPPSFGRGSKGEVFKIEEDIGKLLSLCRECLSKDPVFILLSCHTPSFTPLTLSYLLEDMMGQGVIERGEMVLSSNQQNVRPVPSGAFAIWKNQKLVSQAPRTQK
jgi:23S rRNA (cytosine1962-C5)-methyltransferase